MSPALDRMQMIAVLCGDSNYVAITLGALPDSVNEGDLNT